MLIAVLKKCSLKIARVKNYQIHTRAVTALPSAGMSCCQWHSISQRDAAAEAA